MTTRWEYKLLSPFLEGTKAPGFDLWETRLNQAGAEGWEAVGEIVLVHNPSGGGADRYPQLLLKRPLG